MSQLLFESKVAGTMFHAIKDCKPTQGDPVVLEPEPNNQFDAQAILVNYVKDGVTYKLGYIPRTLTDQVHPLLPLSPDDQAIISYLVLNEDSKKPALCVVAIFGEPRISDEAVKDPDSIPEIDL